MIYDCSPEERMIVTDLVFRKPTDQERIRRPRAFAVASCVAAGEIQASGIHMLVAYRGQIRTDFDGATIRYLDGRGTVRGKRRKTAYYWLMRAAHRLAVDVERRPDWVGEEIAQIEAWL